MSEQRFTKGECTSCYYDICEILCEGEVYCTVDLQDADLIIDQLNNYINTIDDLLNIAIQKQVEITQLKSQLKYSLERELTNVFYGEGLIEDHLMNIAKDFDIELDVFKDLNIDIGVFVGEHND